MIICYPCHWHNRLWDPPSLSEDQSNPTKKAYSKLPCHWHTRQQWKSKYDDPFVKWKDLELLLLSCERKMNNCYSGENDYSNECRKRISMKVMNCWQQWKSWNDDPFVKWKDMELLLLSYWRMSTGYSDENLYSNECRKRISMKLDKQMMKFQ